MPNPLPGNLTPDQARALWTVAEQRVVARRALERARRYAMAVNVSCLTMLGLVVALWLGGMPTPVVVYGAAGWTLVVVLAVALDRFLDATEQVLR